MTTAADIRVGFGFNTPFKEQLDFFRGKLNLPTERWDDIMLAAHDRAFIVAGAAKADLLHDLRQSVDGAIAKGTGLDAFRREFRATVAKHGWTGWTGEGSKAGEAWRTKVIYQTNIATSYAAGRYRQLTSQAALEAMPFWRYIHNDSVLHPRPQHLAWHGLTLKHDDPFWATHFPPNGWGCHCRVRGVRRPAADAPTQPPAGWETTDPKTGAPVGIDRGFGYAPGRTWHPDLDKYPPELARQIVRANLQDGVFDRWLTHVGDRIEQHKTSGSSSMDMRKALSHGEKIAVAILDERGQQALGIQKVDHGHVTQTVWLSDDTAVKQAMHRAGQEMPIGGYVRLQEVLDRAEYVEADGGTRLVYYHDGADLSVAVIKGAANGTELFLLSMRRSSQRELDASIRAGKARKWG